MPLLFLVTKIWSTTQQVVEGVKGMMGKKHVHLYLPRLANLFWCCDIITPCRLLRLSHGCHDSCQCCDRFLLAVHIPFSFSFSPVSLSYSSHFSLICINLHSSPSTHFILSVPTFSYTYFIFVVILFFMCIFLLYYVTWKSVLYLGPFRFSSFFFFFCWSQKVRLVSKVGYLVHFSVVDFNL